MTSVCVAFTGYKVFPFPLHWVPQSRSHQTFPIAFRTLSNITIEYQNNSNRRSNYTNFLTMPRCHLSRHAERDTDNHNHNHNTVSTVPPTAPANTSTNTNKSSTAAVQNTLYNVWCCRCGRLLNLQNVHYVQTCLCMHKRCDCCQTTPL